MKTTQLLSRVALLTGLALGGFSLSALAVWNSAPSSPPNNNTDAPLNAGYDLQPKNGGLRLKGLLDASGATLSQALYVDGPATFANGITLPVGAGQGKVLTSDGTGNATWSNGAGSTAYFGGMYGNDTYGSYTNPLAGNTRGCPTNYKAYQVLGSPNVDWGVFACYGIPGIASKVAVFGGTWSTSYNNIFTAGASCPAGFSSQKILGHPGVDFDLTFCYSTDLSKSVMTEWRGFFGDSPSDHQDTTYFNPLTGGQGCMLNETAARIFGTSGTDYPITLCYIP